MLGSILLTGEAGPRVPYNSASRSLRIGPSDDRGPRLRRPARLNRVLCATFEILLALLGVNGSTRRWFREGEPNCAFRVFQKDVRGIPHSKIPRIQGEARSASCRISYAPQHGGEWSNSENVISEPRPPGLVNGQKRIKVGTKNAPERQR